MDYEGFKTEITTKICGRVGEGPCVRNRFIWSLFMTGTGAERISIL